MDAIVFLFRREAKSQFNDNVGIFAWFTMNKTVTVTGMEMKTKVSGNLLICDNNVEADYSTKQLSQTRKALLEPVSSVNGSDGSFFFTVNAKGNGDAVEDVYIPYTENTTLSGFDTISTVNGHPMTSGAGKEKVAVAFNTGSGSYQNASYSASPAAAYENAYGYVDYVFFLKATADGTDDEIKLTKLNLLYDGGAVHTSGTVGDNVDKAWRAAIFCSNAPAIGTLGDSNAVSGNLKAILALNGATNQTANMAVSATNSAPTALTPIASYNTWADSHDYIAKLGTTSAGTTGYYKVTIRVWLEGEDTTCTSKTYAQLTDAWTLDAEFELGHTGTDATAISGVTEIGSVAP